MVPIESVHSEGVLFSGLKLNPSDNGEPQTQEKFWVPEIPVVYSVDVEKFAEFDGEIIF